MDYRDRHPSSHIWQAKCQSTMQFPAHYGVLSEMGFLEAFAPDGTEFLAISGPLDENEAFSWFYMLEAPKGSPARLLVEAGEMSWIDFWSHKEWLLVMKVLMGPKEDTLATYGTIDDLPPEELSQIKELGTVSPYDLRYMSLEGWLNCQIELKKFGDEDADIATAEKDLQEFVTKYGHRIPCLKSAA